MEGHEHLKDVPGVEDIAISRRPGDAVDWRLGLVELVLSAYGSAADYDEVDQRCTMIDETVTITYDNETDGDDGRGEQTAALPSPTVDCGALTIASIEALGPLPRVCPSLPTVTVASLPGVDVGVWTLGPVRQGGTCPLSKNWRRK